MRVTVIAVLGALASGCASTGVPPGSERAASAPPPAPYQQQPFPEPDGDLAHIRAFAAGNGYSYSARMEEMSMLNYAGWRLDAAQPRGYQMVWADEDMLGVNVTGEADEAAILARFAPEIRDRVVVQRVGFDRAGMLALQDELSQAINAIMPVDSISTYNSRKGRFDVVIVGPEKADTLRAAMSPALRAAADITLAEGPLIVY